MALEVLRAQDEVAEDLGDGLARVPGLVPLQRVAALLVVARVDAVPELVDHGVRPSEPVRRVHEDPDVLGHTDRHLEPAVGDVLDAHLDALDPLVEADRLDERAGVLGVLRQRETVVDVLAGEPLHREVEVARRRLVAQDTPDLVEPALPERLRQVLDGRHGRVVPGVIDPVDVHAQRDEVREAERAGAVVPQVGEAPDEGPDALAERLPVEHRRAPALAVRVEPDPLPHGRAGELLAVNDRLERDDVAGLDLLRERGDLQVAVDGRLGRTARSSTSTRRRVRASRSRLRNDASRSRVLPSVSNAPRSRCSAPTGSPFPCVKSAHRASNHRSVTSSRRSSNAPSHSASLITARL